MNATPAPMVAPTFTNRTRSCPECGGSGFYLENVVVYGEAFDADQREVGCDECDRGLVARHCACCDEEAPLNDDFDCADCADVSWTVVVTDMGDQRATVFV